MRYIKQILIIRTKQASGPHENIQRVTSFLFRLLCKEKQAAQDAVYTVKKENDKGQAAQEKTSASNRITLDDEKIEATLKKAGSTQIKVGDDVKGMADKLDNLVKSYNNTVKFLNDNAGQGSGVLDQLRRMSRLPTGEKAMNLAGISVNPKDGTFAFDRDAFAEAMETSPTLTKEIVSGSYGVAQGLRQDAQSGLNTSSAKLVDAMDSFRIHCVDGITADEKQMAGNLNRSLMLVTCLTPEIGYERAAQCAKKALHDGSTLKEAVLALGYLDEAAYDILVRPEKMV